MKAKYVIRLEDNEPNREYFMAVHSYTTFYSSKEKAHRFNTVKEAVARAEELFVPGFWHVEAVEE